jgi:hypothetical protein
VHFGFGGCISSMISREKIMSDDLWKSNYKSMNYQQLFEAGSIRPIGLSNAEWNERLLFILKEMRIKFSREKNHES